MLNRELDVQALAAQFARNKRIQIADVLELPAAERISGVLRTQTQWKLAFNRGKENVTMSQQELAALGSEGSAKLVAECFQGARTGFQFVYSSYPIVEAIVARRDVGHPLHDVLAEINGPEFRSFVEEVTGIPGLVKADGQATLYTRGNFLTLHNDFDARMNRKVAYVLGFTKGWRSDWGGMLEFYDDKGDVEAGFLPRFNVLSLFAVPQNHAVTFVPNYVAEGRYSITGWFSAAS